MEALAIQRAIETHGGNISAAARQLGISRNTLYRKMKAD
jgi:transcriptional regulator of acetoin/glycerol metabolism